MINTRKTMAAGVAASIGVMIWVLQPAFAASVAMHPSGMTGNSGAPITYCELVTLTGTKCRPSETLQGGAVTFNVSKCYDFYT